MTRAESLLDAARTVGLWRARPPYTRERIRRHVARQLGCFRIMVGDRRGDCAAPRDDPGLSSRSREGYRCREARTSAGQETDPLTCKTRRGGGKSHHRPGSGSYVWQHRSSPNSKIFASVFCGARDAPGIRLLLATSQPVAHSRGGDAMPDFLLSASRLISSKGA